MNRLERLIGYVSPSWRAKREYARMSLEIAERQYEGASRNRRTAGWITGGGSANSEIFSALPTLRNRSRDLVRNNGYARRAISILVSAMVGDGVKAKFQMDLQGQVFARWQTYCDADGLTSFSGLLELIENTRRVSGEALVRFRVRRAEDGFEVPLQLQVLEPDHIDSSRNETLANGYIMSGVQFNTLGQRVGYWLFREHPGEIVNTLRAAGRESVFVPASEVIHYFKRERPSQVRGVPDVTAAIMRMRDLDDYESAELVRKKIEACFSVFITNNQPSVTALAGSEAASNGRAVDKLAPGMVAHLANGEGIEFATPSVNAGYGDYVKSQLRAIAAAFGITYEQLTCDLSSVNYSSIRAGLIEFKRQIVRDQWNLMVPQLLVPIMQRWVQLAQLRGYTAFDMPLEWTMPKFEWTDPLKEILGDKEAVRAGFKTLPEVIRSMGYDPDQVFKEAAETKQKLADMGLTFDSSAEVSEGLVALLEKSNNEKEGADRAANQRGDLTEWLKNYLTH